MLTLEDFSHQVAHEDTAARRAAISVFLVGMLTIVAALLAMAWLRGGLGGS